MESNEQNMIRGMDKWNRLTDIRGEKGRGRGVWKRLAKEHIHMYADNTVAKARGGERLGGRG